MKKLFLLSAILFSLNLWAEELIIVPVGEAELKTSNISVTYNDKKLTPTQKNAIKTIAEVVVNDFNFYKNKFLAKINGANPEFKMVIEGYTGPSKFKVAAKFLDANNKELGNATSTVNFNNPRFAAHHLSDSLYRLITSKESIFKSRILFVSDRTSVGKKIRKELYIMDFDGANQERLTYHNGTVIGPALSTSGKLALYSLIKDEEMTVKNIDLYLIDLETRKTQKLLSKRGINSGAVFMENDNEILLTLSNSGNANIYRYNLKTKSLTPVTKHFAIDVDPSINGDGSLMTFLSGRAGAPMIYTMDPRSPEKDVKRISYVGKYNAAPRFSPDGKEIVFSSWLDNCFDLFKIDADGTNLARLTKNFGSNEDATYSNDGEFIAFTSKRVLSRYKAKQNIYIIDREGSVIGSITKDFGNCTSPRWSR